MGEPQEKGQITSEMLYFFLKVLVGAQFIEESVKSAPQPVLFHFKPQQFAMAYIVHMEILTYKIAVRDS